MLGTQQHDVYGQMSSLLPDSSAAGTIVADLWVQCDACLKWRKIPPLTQIDESGSW